jgi:hypothetical protein
VTATVRVPNPDAQEAGGEPFSTTSPRPVTASATATVTATVMDYDSSAQNSFTNGRVSIDGPVNSNLLGTLTPDHPAAAAAIAAAAKAAEAAALAAANRASRPNSPLLSPSPVNVIQPLTFPAAVTMIETQLEAPGENVPPPSLNTPVGIQPLKIPKPVNQTLNQGVEDNVNQGANQGDPLLTPGKLPTIMSGFVTENELQYAANLGVNEAATILTPRGGTAVQERFEEGLEDGLGAREPSIIEGLLPPDALQKWARIGKRIRIGLIPAGKHLTRRWPSEEVCTTNQSGYRLVNVPFTRYIRGPHYVQQFSERPEEA